MEQILLLSITIVTNILISYFLPIVSSKLWFLICNVFWISLILVLYIFLSRKDIIFIPKKTIKILFMLIFFWSVANFVLAMLGYTTARMFLIRHPTNFINEKEMSVLQENKTVLIGKIIGYSHTTDKQNFVFNARVVLKDENDKFIVYETFSDSTGEFKIDLFIPNQEAVYNLYINHPDYNPYFTQVRLNSRITKELEILLIQKRRVI